MDKWYQTLVTDDKNLVIIAVLIITVTAMLLMGIESKEITVNALTGLFGIAVGKSLSP